MKIYYDELWLFRLSQNGPIFTGFFFFVFRGIHAIALRPPFTRTITFRALMIAGKAACFNTDVRFGAPGTGKAQALAQRTIWWIKLLGWNNEQQQRQKNGPRATRRLHRFENTGANIRDGEKSSRFAVNFVLGLCWRG